MRLFFLHHALLFQKNHYLCGNIRGAEWTQCRVATQCKAKIRLRLYP